jgi:putative membrane protein
LVYGGCPGGATWYGVVGGDLRHEQGILFRRSRRIRLDRLQSVDVVRPLVARLLGLAELRLEVAGGSGPEAPLAYLSEGDALRLRAELLARAAGIAQDTPEAPERHPAPGTARPPRPVRAAVPGLHHRGAAHGGLFVLGRGARAVRRLRAARLGGPRVLTPPVRRFMRHFEFTLAESPTACASVRD